MWFFKLGLRQQLGLKIEKCILSRTQAKKPNSKTRQMFPSENSPSSVQLKAK